MLQALVRRTYVSMVRQRRDQSVLALGRSGTGKTTACMSFVQELLKQAGTAGGSVTGEECTHNALLQVPCVSQHQKTGNHS